MSAAYVVTFAVGFAVGIVLVVLWSALSIAGEDADDE
ncbi:MAG: hypothetical protein NAOJABEB_03292 [Steroidobacteraceae bacterium]|nr:hypothetical protein [Steroidobacteraceae bacterium]